MYSETPAAAKLRNGAWLRVQLGLDTVFGCPDKMTALETLKARFTGCSACTLGRSRKSLVFGGGNPFAPVVFVGEAPGADEDRLGKPFVGRAGAVLTKLLADAGFDRERDTYIANILKCRPPSNRDPHLDEVDACTPILREQIRVISPALVIALGRYAGRFLLGYDTSQESVGMGLMRGRTHIVPDSPPVLVTYHPSATFRNPAYAERIADDLRAARRHLFGEPQASERE